jgi:hypothetical protein
LLFAGRGFGRLHSRYLFGEKIKITREDIVMRPHAAGVKVEDELFLICKDD